METIRMALVRDVTPPTRGTSHSAGIDFFIPNDWNGGKPFHMAPGTRVLIPAGVHVDLIGSGLEDWVLDFQNKSGIATKKGLLVGAQVVDADYQGEVHINMHNTTNEYVTVNPGDKIVQGLLVPVAYSQPEFFEYDELYTEETERGTGGFGSTGA